MSEPSREEILAQLGTLCKWKGLAVSSKRVKLLRYVVETTLDGNPSDLKESIIGVKAYDREADWDNKHDASVRVAMGKIRTQLTAYYKNEGASDTVLIIIEPGAYRPEFYYRNRWEESPPPTGKSTEAKINEKERIPSPEVPAAPIREMTTAEKMDLDDILETGMFDGPGLSDPAYTLRSLNPIWTVRRRIRGLLKFLNGED
ncbi:MAG: hypothetical protein ABL967_01445 [Bryobacteraceae bacterium]